MGKEKWTFEGVAGEMVNIFVTNIKRIVQSTFACWVTFENINTQEIHYDWFWMSQSITDGRRLDTKNIHIQYLPHSKIKNSYLSNHISLSMRVWTIIFKPRMNPNVVLEVIGFYLYKLNITNQRSYIKNY